MLKKVAMEFCSELGHDTLCAIMALNFNEDQCCHPNMVVDATLLSENQCCHPNIVMDATLLKEAKSATCVYNRVHSSCKID